MTRIKITLSDELKATLERIAESQGTSLSKLIVDAAIEVYICHPRSQGNDLGKILRKLDAIESKMHPQVGGKPEPRKASKRKYADRLPREGAATFFNNPSPVVSEALRQTLSIHELVERFGGDRALKARLCQLGGRNGNLFRGSMPDAQRVEKVTKELDPDGLPWMPVAEDRRSWIQMDAQTYCKAIWNQS
jgi:predicted transcriptional regulator